MDNNQKYLVKRILEHKISDNNRQVADIQKRLSRGVFGGYQNPSNARDFIAEMKAENQELQNIIKEL